MIFFFVARILLSIFHGLYVMEEFFLLMKYHFEKVKSILKVYFQNDTR